ncbi:plasmid mobilization protein [Methylocystis rosea]|uniref:plasmid mobilization protein n=1 Tax=Methylocystis rosea TaxID=173366 RepID=UPI0012EBA58E|nr:hypothetical protein [Methylocystis rosea]
MGEKDYTLQVRMSESEKKAFEMAASSAGISISAWVRDRLRRVARDELQSSGLKVPFIEEMKAKDGD